MRKNQPDRLCERCGGTYSPCYMAQRFCGRSCPARASRLVIKRAEFDKIETPVLVSETDEAAIDQSRKDARMQSGIYFFKNITNGRFYVGSALYLRGREIEHLRMLERGIHHSIKFQRSWDTYGATGFVYGIIEIVEEKTKLIEREQFWIDRLSAADPSFGLNVQPSAQSPLGTKRSDEFREKTRIASTGRKMPPRTKEHRERLSVAHKGRAVSAETRAKMSAGHVGVKRGPLSESHRQKIRENNLRRGPPSAESRARMSAAQKARNSNPLTKKKPLSAESRAKISASLTGKTQSPETIEKRRLSMVGYVASPETCAKISAGLMGHVLSPETRAKIGDAHRGKKRPSSSPELAARRGRGISVARKRRKGLL